MTERSERLDRCRVKLMEDSLPGSSQRRVEPSIVSMRPIGPDAPEAALPGSDGHPALEIRRNRCAETRLTAVTAGPRLDPRTPSQRSDALTPLSIGARIHPAFMRPVKMGKPGYRGKRRNRIRPWGGDAGRRPRGLVFGDDEEAVELHDGEQVVDDRLEVVDDDLARPWFRRGA